MQIDDCNLPYTWYNEAKDPFGSNINATDLEKFRKTFNYTKSNVFSLIYSSPHATYMSGGYIHDIQGDTPELIKSGFKYLKDHNWIDRNTRAIFLTFGLYNPNANFFVLCTFLLEQLPATKQVIFQPIFEPFKLVQLYTGADLIYCLLYLALIIYYMVVEIKLLIKKRKAYIKQFWSYMTWGIIACSWTGVAIHVFRQTEMKKMASTFKKENGKLPVNLQFFTNLDSLLTHLLGFCCFFGTLKV